MHNAWFINFSGIGNGIAIAPILRSFERSYPTAGYYHTENEVLADSWFLKKAELKNLRGFSPVEWRRFKEENWSVITSFIREKGVDLVVNLRNEGPRYDTGYFRFKERTSKRSSDPIFWNLDFEVIESRRVYQNLTGDILTLFRVHGIDISGYNPRWLSSIRGRKNERGGVGFGMAAGQANKRWPTTKWVELARRICSDLGQKVVLFPGKSEEEIKEATSVLESVGSVKCELVKDTSLRSVASRIGRLSRFVSNDTGLLHIAVAINVPTVGLYISTNPDVWSPHVDSNFFPCRNSFMERCPAPKLHCGNCFHYYDVCPAIAKYGDDISPDCVYEIVFSIVDL